MGTTPARNCALIFLVFATPLYGANQLAESNEKARAIKYQAIFWSSRSNQDVFGLIDLAQKAKQKLSEQESIELAIKVAGQIGGFATPVTNYFVTHFPVETQAMALRACVTAALGYAKDWENLPRVLTSAIREEVKRLDLLPKALNAIVCEYFDVCWGDRIYCHEHLVGFCPYYDSTFNPFVYEAQSFDDECRNPCPHCKIIRYRHTYR